MPRITDKTALTTSDPADVLPVVDTSDTSANAAGTLKKITWTNLIASITGLTKTALSSSTSFGVSNKVLLNFVPRTPSSSSWDYTTQHFAWTTVDLSSFVSTTAVRVRLRAIWNTNNATARLMFAKGGTFTATATTPNTTNDPRIASLISANSSAAAANVREIEVDLDSNQDIMVFQDNVAGTVSGYGFQIIGWYEPAAG